jgi:beta-glucosidase
VFGEDPHLTSELAVSIVTGMQGNREGETVAADGGALMAGACCKHYAVYSSENIPEDRTVLNVNVSARSLHETYLPAMKACVVRAKATHVMCSCTL